MARTIDKRGMDQGALYGFLAADVTLTNELKDDVDSMKTIMTALLTKLDLMSGLGNDEGALYAFCSGTLVLGNELKDDVDTMKTVMAALLEKLDTDSGIGTATSTGFRSALSGSVPAAIGAADLALAMSGVDTGYVSAIGGDVPAAIGAADLSLSDVETES